MDSDLHALATAKNFSTLSASGQPRTHVMWIDAARGHIDAVSRRYVDQDYQGKVQSERVIVQIAPERLHKNLV